MRPVDQYGRILWVAGSPVDHTLSPVIHNTAFERAGLPHRYFAVEVEGDELEQFVDTFRAVGALGANFTIPLKETAPELIDQQTEAVDCLGAANTLYRESGRLKLDNTDVYGFKKLVEPWHDQISDGAVLVLGAGGAARACLLAMDQLDCERVYLWNRTSERAHQLRDEFDDLAITCLSDDELHSGRFEASIVVNATSLGLNAGDASPLPPSVIHEDMVGVDLIYNRRTAFVDEISNRGKQAVGGLAMLVYQAAKAWEHWVGEHPDVDVMFEAARETLRTES